MILTFVDILPNMYLGIAITFSTFFLLQSVMTLFGNIDDLGSDSDMDSSFDIDEDMDFDVDEDMDFDLDEDMDIDDEMSLKFAESGTPFYLFSLRAILGFFILFGWTGYLMSTQGIGALLTAFVSVVAGVVAMFAVSYLVFLLYKLTQDGTMNIRNSIGTEGTVYLKIPGRGNGTGKVQIVIAGALKTMDAISTDTEIQSGQKVRVVELEKELLVVEEITKVIVERKE